jgi:gamma-glutamyl phosphate reductase
MTLDQIAQEAYASFDSLVGQYAKADQEENRERVRFIIRKVATSILDNAIEELRSREQETRSRADFETSWRDRQMFVLEADGLKEAIEHLETLKDLNEHEDSQITRELESNGALSPSSMW